MTGVPTVVTEQTDVSEAVTLKVELDVAARTEAGKARLAAIAAGTISSCFFILGLTPCFMMIINVRMLQGAESVV
jgi:hypothetical protein